MNINRKTSIIITLICITLLITSCVNRYSTTESYNVSDLIEESNAEGELEQKLYADENKWKYDKHYEGGVFFNDYSKEIEELTEKFSKKIDKRFIEYQGITKNYTLEKDSRKPYSFQYFYELEVEFYNSSLEAYKNKTLSSDELFENEREHIREIKLTAYSFTDKNCTVYGVNRLQEELHEEYFNKDIWIEMTGRSYDESILESKNIEEISAMESPIIYLESQGIKRHIYYYPKGTKLHNICNTTRVKEKREDLVKRYNEEFVFINKDFESDHYLFAPVRNTDLTFEVDFDNTSKYPAVMVQKMVSERIYEILEKNNVADRIVFFTTAAEIYEYEKKDKFNTLEFNFTKPFDDLLFVNDLVPRGVQTSFYYLYDSNSTDVDYVQIKKIIEDSQSLYPPREGEWVFYINVYFIDLSDEKRKIAVELFKGKDHTENAFHTKSPGLNLSGLFIRRTNHEGFRFLDVYAKKDNKHMSFGSLEIKDITVDEFVERYTYKKEIWE